MGTYRYHWREARCGTLGIKGHERTHMANGRVVPASKRRSVQFGPPEAAFEYFETDDPALAKAIEATPPFKRNEINRVGNKPVVVSATPVTTLAAILEIVQRLPGLPAGDDDNEFGGFEMPTRLEVA